VFTKRSSFTLLIVLLMIIGTLGAMPVHASPASSNQSDHLIDEVNDQPNDCEPGSGLMWTNGPLEPEIAG